jgi:hypothetical protein
MLYLAWRMGAIDRRRFLGLAGAAGVLATTGSALATTRTSRASGRWSDPRTWGGTTPRRGDAVRISHRVVVDADARVAGAAIERGGMLIFERGAARTLRTTGNVVVRGELVMRPGSREVIHRIVFLDVDEERFVGGGHDVLSTDVGLWVVGGGKLDLSGSPKQAWALAVGSATGGDTTITLDREPLGWIPGDEISIAPTAPPDSPGHRNFHEARVVSVSGTVVTLDRSPMQDHPAVPSSDGRSFTAEVINLTRNVRIEGTPGGRTHVFIRSRRRQLISFASVRHSGPRRRRGSFTKSVLGRYGVHFHHAYEGSRGSLVEGVVVRDCGNHCFVPHVSHGITFRSCIAYDSFETPFWWDEGDVTNHVTWEECISALVEPDDQTVAHDITGFFLGKGEGNVARRCTAVGIGGRLTASGFQWPPEPANAVWIFEDCIAHNNAVNGIFVWQRVPDVSTIERFAGYHNGKAGIEHGSFKNAFVYSDSLLLGNAGAQVMLHANSTVTGGTGLTFSSVRMEGGGAGVDILHHTIATPDPVRFESCSFAGGDQVPVRVSEQGGGAGGKSDFLLCTVGPGGRDLEPSDFLVQFMSPATELRVQGADDTAFRLERDGGGVPIPPFET